MSEISVQDALRIAGKRSSKALRSLAAEVMRLNALFPATPSAEWRAMSCAPTEKDILLWNAEHREISIGYKPLDAPAPDCVVILRTAAYADAWYPLPEHPAPDSYQQACPHPGCTQTDGAPCAYPQCPQRSRQG